MSILDKAVERIWNDLSGRKGLRHELESYDKEIQTEIKAMMRAEIEGALLECLKRGHRQGISQ